MNPVLVTMTVYTNGHFFVFEVTEQAYKDFHSWVWSPKGAGYDPSKEAFRTMTDVDRATVTISKASIVALKKSN